MKVFFILFLIAIFTLPAFSQIAPIVISGNEASIGGSLGLGAVIAVIASWSRNQSVLWAIIHAFLGWFYVIYFVLTR